MRGKRHVIWLVNAPTNYWWTGKKLRQLTKVEDVNHSMDISSCRIIYTRKKAINLSKTWINNGIHLTLTKRKVNFSR